MINLQPYDSAWPLIFETEKTRLQNILSDVVIAIDHIGSTAIGTIQAKPVIDILIGVTDLKQLNAQHFLQLEQSGYLYLQQYEAEIPNRRFFQKRDQHGVVTHHIHMVNANSAWQRRHVLFRDYLRKDLKAAGEYESLKLGLARSLNEKSSDNFFDEYLKQHPELKREFQRLKNISGEDFTVGNQYALAKTELINEINRKAYFDFDIHLPDVTTRRLNGFIPQMACLEIYRSMFQDADFIRCFGVEFDNQRVRETLERDTHNWDRYGFGPWAWFDGDTGQFVGEGGLNHTCVDGKEEIELTYSLMKDHWGKGLAIEIGQFAIEHAFKNLRLKNIVCFTMTTNRQSLSVIQKLGFKFEKAFSHCNLPHKLFRLS